MRSANRSHSYTRKTLKATDTPWLTLPVDKVLFMFFIAVFLSGCQGKQENKAAPISTVFTAERNAFFNSLQDPAEASAILLPALSRFDKSLLHNPKDFHRYASNDVKAAANLGIYLADLNYCILFKESDSGKEYLESAIELSKVMLLDKKILTFLMSRYESNLAQNDSLHGVMNQLLSESTKGLQGTARERLAGIAMASYQLENLHLALTTLETFPATMTEEQHTSKELLFQFVSGQQARLEIVYNFIKAHTDPLDPDRNPNYPFYDNALRELLYLYQQSSTQDLNMKELLVAVRVLRDKMISIE